MRTGCAVEEWAFYLGALFLRHDCNFKTLVLRVSCGEAKEEGTVGGRGQGREIANGSGKIDSHVSQSYQHHPCHLLSDSAPRPLLVLVHDITIMPCISFAYFGTAEGEASRADS